MASPPSMLLLWMGAMVGIMLVMEGAGGSSSLFNQPDWGFWSYLDEDYTLHCDHSHLSLQPPNFIRWELPSGELLDSSSDKYELTSDANGQVINMHLTIRNVQDTDSGVYLCHVYSTATLQDKLGQVVRGLNLGGHLYREPFDHYRHCLLVAGCTAAAFLVIFTAGCLVYKFRYRAPPSQRRGHDGFANHVIFPQRTLENGGQGREFAAVIVRGGGEGEMNRSYGMEMEEIDVKM